MKDSDVLFYLFMSVIMMCQITQCGSMLNIADASKDIARNIHNLEAEISNQNHDSCRKR